MRKNSKFEGSAYKKDFDFRLLAESIPDIIARFNMDLKIVYINRLLDKSDTNRNQNNDILTEKNIPHQVIQKCLPAIKQTFKSGNNSTIEISIPFKNEIRYYESRIIPEKNSKNNFETVICITRDITEWKLAENELIRSEEKFRRLFQYSPVGIFYYNTKFIITNFNKKFVSILRSKRELLQNLNLNNLQDKSIIPALKEALEGKEGIYEGAYLTTTSNIKIFIQLQAAPIYKQKKEIIGGICNIQDITERINAEEAQKESEERYKVLANATSEAIFISEKGICIDTNNTACKMFGYAYDELIGIFGTDVIAEESKELVKKNMLGGYEEPYEAFAIKKDGTKFPALFHGKMFEYKGKKTRLTICRDLTIQKQYENELIEAKEKAQESDRLKSAFLANMSHEIRTPMNGIIGFSEMLLNPNVKESKRIHYSKVIIESSKQLLSIVNDILDISRIETGQVEITRDKVMINNLIFELFTFFNPKIKNNNVSFYPYKELTDDESVIYTDGFKLKQVLNNLLSNAMKFTHEGHIKFGYKLKKYSIEFFVEDTGIGIKPELYEKIFERFHQAEMDINRLYGGTGLGLAISKKLVELLGGKIWLNSSPNKGSTFYFTIPYNPVYSKSQKSQKLTIVEETKLVILVVEDEETNYLFLEEVLSENGYTIMHARNGEEAINYCMKYPNIQLVLMDLKMPKIDGFEATRKIKEIRPKLKIIAQTAYAMKNDREKALEAGCDDYVAKPIEIAKLKKLIKKHL